MGRIRRLSENGDDRIGGGSVGGEEGDEGGVGEICTTIDSSESLPEGISEIKAHPFIFIYVQEIMRKKDAE